ncbi:uncharacterized protein LAESUDRAFT_756995 [Laetiporus sulphureus 93-53]|uniref:Uncharacterized protein n=1 Tax=Laetiporus sulphureus 93-53 TaxID=1314785 RepID=A0A165FT62_9APHY|nr:uncharacterized protein LAESUDRAFT_756995 [Laetiporus sulphureus 93-53]KZT09378.1 hypothetical protein LAESUDRAFT_756995 [Laetiporus sulphureus 93-53]
MKVDVVNFGAETSAQNDSRYSVKDIKEALEGMRQHYPTKSFDERVSQVSVMLGLQ